MKIQSDILAFIKHITDQYGRSQQRSIGFETDLPDFIMDFDPSIIYNMQISLLERITADSQPDQTLLTQARQLSPSHFSILMEFKSQGFLDVEPYRQLLQAVNGELIHQITKEGNTNFQIDLPIYNQCGYLSVEEVIKLLPTPGSR